MTIPDRNDLVVGPRPSPLDERLARLLPFAVVAGVISGCLTTWWLYGTEMIDLQVYRSGAAALLHGHAIYQAHPAGSFLVFTYPPFATIVFAPFAVLPNLGAQIVFSALSAAALLVVIVVGVRLIASTWSRRSQMVLALAVTAAAPLFQPVRQTIRFGQVNLILMALVVLDLSGVGPKRFRGAWIGVATAIKITPGVFILYLFALRRTREAVIAGLTTVAATVAAFVVAPSASWQYWTKLLYDDRRVGQPSFVWNQSLRGTLIRIAGSAPRASLSWLVGAVVVVVVGLTVATAAARSGDQLFGLGLAALTGLLVSPISWHHHWVWAVPLSMSLWHRWGARGGWARLVIAVMWTATFTLAALWWWSRPGPEDYRLGIVPVVVANSYVLAGLVLLVAAGWELSREARRQSTAAAAGPIP